MISDQLFKERLNKSKEGVQIVAEALKSLGMEALIHPTLCRPTREQRKEYSDSGDIEVRFRVEVKRRHNIQFSGRDDYPFPTIHLDKARRVDELGKNTLFAYVVLNDQGSCMAVCGRETMKHWVKENRYDRIAGCQDEVYACPKERAKFFKLYEQ